MKRNSLLSITILLTISMSAKAYDDSYYIPLRYRTHWSPYTQSMVSGPVRYDPHNLRYGRSSLVSDYLNYLPYNMSYDKSSLVCDDLHYAPYALAYDSDNLIDYWTRYLPYDLSYNNPCLFDVASCGSCYGNYSEA